MTLILSGTDGLSDIDGSAATPAIRGTDANTGIFFPAADTIAFSEGGTEAMRIDSAGNVGIGTSSPGQKLEVAGNILISTSGNPYMEIKTSGAGNNPYLRLTASTTYWDVAGVFSDSADPLQFAYGGSEKMRLDSSGNFQFNSGYGSVATAYGCRAWVNFNGTGVVAIRASGNVTSITDNGVGDYTVNFTTAMPDANYSVASSANRGVADTGGSSYTFVAGSAKIRTYPSATGTLTDSEYVSVAIFR